MKIEFGCLLIFSDFPKEILFFETGIDFYKAQDNILVFLPEQRELILSIQEALQARRFGRQNSLIRVFTAISSEFVALLLADGGIFLIFSQKTDSRSSGNDTPLV